MLKYRAGSWAALLAVGWLAIGPATVRAADASWERWVSIPGHCVQTCIPIRVIDIDRSIHAQGHLAFSVNPKAGPPSAPVVKVSRQPTPQGVLDFIGYWGIPAAALALLVALLAAVTVQAIRRRAS